MCHIFAALSCNPYRYIAATRLTFTDYPGATMPVAHGSMPEAQRTVRNVEDKNEANVEVKAVHYKGTHKMRTMQNFWGKVFSGGVNNA